MSNGSLLIAATGLTQQQKRLDTIADNVANVNTTGFKNSRLDFKDALFEAGMYAYANEEENQQRGHGVLVSAIARNFLAGAIQVTERDLDFALEGNGFFQLEGRDGETYYTRAGNFYANTIDDEIYLVNSNGYYVLDNVGERLVLPEDAVGFEVSATGEISYRTTDGDLQNAGVSLGIVTFANPHGLEAIGSSNFIATEASGDAEEAETAVLRQGALEASNVNLADEFTRLIRAQRAYSLASRALTTADDMEGIVNNMRR